MNFYNEFETKEAGGGDDLSTVIDNLGRAHEEFKSRYDRELAEIKKGIKSAPADLEKLNTALDTLQAAKDAMEAKMVAQAKTLADMEKRFGRPGGSFDGSKALDAAQAELKNFNNLTKSHARKFDRPTPAEMDAEAYAQYKAAYATFLRKGDHNLDVAERKTMMVGSDPDGGYLVQADMNGRIVQRIYETSPMRQIASVQAISTDALEGINDLDQAGDLVMGNENAQPGNTTTPQIGKWRIPVFEGYVEPKATQQLLEDAAVDVEAWLARKVADRIGRGQNRQFIVGEGINGPKGVTKYTTAATADDTRTWGQLQHVNTGASSDFAASNPADVFFDLIGAFRDQYLQNARFLTRREVITKVRKFKESTTGNYLWQPGLQAGQPQTLLNFPVSIAQDMPALASGSLSLAFGDFAEGYQIVDRLGISIIRDHLTAKPFVKFYTRTRFGGGVLNFEAIKFLRFGT